MSDYSSELDVAVIGAGPAGLMAAGAAAAAGAKTAVFEQLPKPGTKLLATGGGRCNLTNTLDSDSLMARFGRQGRFMQPALAEMDPAALRAFFDELGVPTTSPDGFHVFPASNSAGDVLDALLHRCKEEGASVVASARVKGLWMEKGVLRGLEIGGQDRVTARRVIVAAGGKSYPALGATGDGYALAAQAGHRIIEPLPAGVPLVTREAWPRELAGVTLPAVRLWIDLPSKPALRFSRGGTTGDLLFTHRGVSGPAVLDLSGDAAERLRKQSEIPLRFDPTPGTSATAWLVRFDSWGHKQGARMLRTLLALYVPAALAGVVCRLAGLGEEIQAAQITRAERNRLAEIVTGLPLTVTGTEGFEHSMITRGGVSLKEVDPHTLQSRKTPGLFFAGEVLDLDGPCGGYNLQWAFSSGLLAGRSAAK